MRDLPRGIALVLVGACVLLAAGAALRGLGSVLLFGDEFHSVRNLDLPWLELAQLFDRNGSGLLLPLLQKLAVALFGESLWSYRLPAIAGALATLVLLYPTGAFLFGRSAAVLAVAALAANAMHVFYSRYARAYSLAAAFGLLFVLALSHLVLDERPRRRWTWLAVLAGGLAPYAHPSSAALLVGAGAGALACELARRGRGARLVRLCGTLGAGALLALLLHLPAWDSLRAFFEAKALEGVVPFGSLDVATLIAGSRSAGVVLLAALPAALGAALLRERSRAWIALGACIGPPIGLLVTHPSGLVYAYARYLFAALPFALLFLAAGLMALARFVPIRGGARAALALGAGLGLVILGWIRGPLGVAHTSDGPFANSNLGLHPLGAFDVPWRGTSAFYRIIAESGEPLRIVEAPELCNRGALLYRNLWLQHRSELVAGCIFEETAGRVPDGPYVDLSERAALAGLDADYLVLHHAIYDELVAYWGFVFEEAWPPRENSAEAALMAAHINWGVFQQRPEPIQALERRARATFGDPLYEDAFVRVWDLRR